MDFLNNYFKYENGIHICGLTNELSVFYVVNLFKKEQKNIILLFSSLYEANKFYNLIQTHTSNALLFLMDDFLSSALKAASPEMRLTRLNTLDKMKDGPHIIIANLMGYLKYLPTSIEKDKLLLEENKEFDRSNLISILEDYGYTRSSLTSATGEYSVRGMIVDIFLINEKHPIRIEFDDNVISNIRYFDEDTQKSINQINSITIKPVAENSSSENMSLNDYAGDNITIFFDDKQIKTAYDSLQNSIVSYNESENNSDKLMYELNEINPSYQIFINNFNDGKSLEYHSNTLDNFNNDFDLLHEFVNKNILNHKKIVFCLSTDNEIKRIKSEFKNEDIMIIKQKINKGFAFNDYIVIGEYDIDNVKREYKYQNNFYGGKRVVNYEELSIGDFVVHVAHGIGVYNGIVTLTKNGVKKDYIQLLYDGSDKIYIPANKITNIYKYSDKDGLKPKLNKLNSNSWLKTRALVKKKIEDISRELMDLYEKRAGINKAPYRYYEEEDIFGSLFPFDLTFDQKKAINDINNDLSSNKPMDRLLCGDVGFGKTEVAFRSMFKTVLNNEQVVYLCPTTILSKQQFNVAKKRFANYAIEIALLNRFTSIKEEKRIYEGLAKGTIDIVFGTHKLLNKAIKYKKLGLMVVDEEQRFGVKHKETIKALKEDINVLTLSATPIPRTLKMALSGLRDLSIIDTAPMNRYPVQTYVINENDLIIKDAIYKELSRDGQVFILFNNVENIENKVDHLRRLIPGEEIRYAHGQMDKNKLDKIMDDFASHKFNIIVCTTIIENGIDIPSANTLIVFDADRFGLSQLYQIRGRVGRSDKIAYVYLMYNEHKMLNEIAIKRLQAIKEFTALGSGYRIAMRDLSLRGAGDIFGSSQAGFVDSVGITLYTKMIEDEMNRLKGNPIIEEDDSEPLLNIETHIENNYVSDEDIKIEIHQMINEIDSFDKLVEIKNTLEDRFGKVSENLENYMYEQWFEKIAMKLGIKKVVQNDRFVEIELPEEVSNNVKGDKLLYESYSICKEFSLSYRHKCIIITLHYKNLPQHFTKYLIKLLNTICI